MRRIPRHLLHSIPLIPILLLLTVGSPQDDRTGGSGFSPDGPFGCTIVMAARDGLVLAGNNEDRNHPATFVQFLPATDQWFGRVVFGYDDAPFQGGMNDQGLFIDGNALSAPG